MQNFVNLKKNKSTGQTSCIIPCKLSCSLHYLYILYLYSVTKKKKTYAHFTRQEIEHKLLYRRYAEQFKLHFTYIRKSKIEY